MTDTDKLKRLAEGLIDDDDCPMLLPPQAILSLIAENERLRAEKRNMQAVFNDTVGECDKLSTERDEGVALLRKLNFAYRPEVGAFLARIDAAE